MGKKGPMGARAPEHLSDDAKRMWRRIVADFELEEHHRAILQAALESWDRMTAARRVIDADGPTYTDRFGQPHSRPEIRIEQDAKISFVRCMRELNLDEAPADSRPPVISGRYR